MVAALGQISRRRAAALLLASLALPAASGATDAVVDVELLADAYGEGEPSLQGWLRLAPRVTRHLAPRLVLTVAPVLEADTHGDLERGTLYADDDRGPRRAPLRFDRLSLRLDLGRVTLEIGKQPLTWGRTDAINPTDNLTPRDWTDPLREVRLSPWALRVHFERGRWSGELAAVPRYAASRLPRFGGRWAELEPVRLPNPLFPAAGPPELAVEPVFGAPEFPATAFDEMQVGVRFGRRGRRGEWALSYYRGFDDAPHFDLAVGPPDLNSGSLPVTLVPRFPRLEVAGADGVLLAGPWALRAEVGRFHFPAGDDDGYWLYELDAEWTRAAWRLVAGYADFSGAERVGVSGAAAGDAGAAVALDLGFLPAAFLHLGRALPSEWEVSFEATVGTAGAGTLLRLSGSWPANDAVRLGAALDLIDGDSGSFFGAWRDNDRLQLFLKLAY